MPLLQGRPGRRGQASSSTAGPSQSRPRQHHNGASDELPPYQPPSHPLNDAARRALDQISNNRNTRQLEKHLAKSTELIRDAVGATNDRACEANEKVKQIEARHREQKTAKTDAEEEVTEYAEGFSEEVSRVTGQLEAALRQNIDYRAELEDESEVLQAVRDQVQIEAQTWKPKPVAGGKRKNKRRKANADLDEDEDDNEEEEQGEEDVEMAEADDNPPLHGVNNLLQSARRAKAEEWARTDMVGRYAHDNSYKLFKRTMHDAQNPDGAVPLPHASAWFGPDGPILPKVGEIEAGDGEDELQIVGAKLDTKCPLSMTEMTEPFTSSRCKHSFQKEAILEFIRTWRPGAQGSRCICPVVGCDQVSSKHPSPFLFFPPLC
jgi:hypothetical protein